MFEKTTLKNGLRIVTSSMPHTRAVSISIYVGAGSRYEPAEKAGISHFIEHMCFKGTKKRPTSREISETIEGIGGVLNAGTDRELTVYWAKVAKPHFDVALDLLVDVLRSSKFDAQEMEKERLVVLEELNMTNEYPGHRAEAILEELMWPDNALGRDVGGTKTSVQNIVRDDMVEYIGHQYVLSNMVVSAAGDIDHKYVVDKVKRLMKGWPVGKLLDWQRADGAQDSSRFKLEYRKSDQAHICMGFHGLSMRHKDRYAGDLLSTVLGEGMSSRLFLEVREKHGLAYDVHSSVDHMLDCGTFGVYAGVDPKRGPKAVQTILGELAKIRDGVSEQELTKAREFAKGRMLLRMEDTRAVAGWIGGQEMLKGEILTVDQVVSRLDAVTTKDVKRVARSLLKEENLTVSIVGPYRGDSQFRKVLKL